MTSVTQARGFTRVKLFSPYFYPRAKYHLRLLSTTINTQLTTPHSTSPVDTNIESTGTLDNLDQPLVPQVIVRQPRPVKLAYHGRIIPRVLPGQLVSQ